MRFEIITPITDAVVIAGGSGVRIRQPLNRSDGSGRWRKMKGFATVRLDDGSLCDAEIHWFEAHGLGRARPQNQAAAPMNKFVICIDNSGNEASLIVGKVYETTSGRWPRW